MKFAGLLNILIVDICSKLFNLIFINTIITLYVLEIYFINYGRLHNIFFIHSEKIYYTCLE